MSDAMLKISDFSLGCPQIIWMFLYDVFQMFVSLYMWCKVFREGFLNAKPFWVEHQDVSLLSRKWDDAMGMRRKNTNTWSIQRAYVPWSAFHQFSCCVYSRRMAMHWSRLPRPPKCYQSRHTQRHHHDDAAAETKGLRAALQAENLSTKIA